MRQVTWFLVLVVLAVTIPALVSAEEPKIPILKVSVTLDKAQLDTLKKATAPEKITPTATQKTRLVDLKLPKDMQQPMMIIDPTHVSEGKVKLQLVKGEIKSVPFK